VRLALALLAIAATALLLRRRQSPVLEADDGAIVGMPTFVLVRTPANAHTVDWDAWFDTAGRQN
jgi:hypothetical protein